MINYKKTDLNEIDEIIRCRMEFIREDMGPQTSEMEATIQAQLQEYLTNHLNRDCYVFAAVEDGRIISVAFLLIQEKPANSGFPHGRVGNIMNVYTVPEKRRQGIAGNIIKQIMDFGKTQNLDFIELKAAPMGYPLYKKLGFEDACNRCKEMILWTNK
ncbi:N-acetyltransferase [Treponema ruminis]|uniref:Putative GNAT family acetyltransferase n=1 Tax=Treponema ruminis TaxID=744515 RepID=A0A7W8LMN8_9SPIR|nr:GNAT family N-acetyltransferase [Treponema ruminis]MBB5226682.1 putative GNAT family acetyltransferase [Treponema ruminis]QSI02090.1 N-acetyltransferase [Treponema ruminis]